MVKIPVFVVSEGGKVLEFVASFASRKPNDTKTAMVGYASQARDDSPEKVTARAVKAAGITGAKFYPLPTADAAQDANGLTMETCGYIADDAGAAALAKVLKAK